MNINLIPNEYFNFVGGDYFDVISRETIYPLFRIEQLDHNENVINEITDEISGESGSITISYQSGVRRSCSVTFVDPYGKFIPNANNGMFWIASKFKLYVGVKDIYTGDVYWFSQGVYYSNNPVVTNSASDRTVTIKGVDKFGIFGSELGFNQLEGTYVIPAGTNAYSAVRSILNLNFGNGYKIDPVAPILDLKYLNTTLPYDINKPPSGYLSDILIEIANVLGADIFYNTDGRLVISSGTTDISYSGKSPIYDFTDVLPEYFNSSITYDYVRTVNVVKVVGANINSTSGIISAIEKNQNPLSPTCLGVIPTKVKYVENANITNLTQAQDLAKYVLKKESVVALAMDFSCSLIPHLYEDSVVTVTDGYYNYERQRFIIQGMTIPLSCSNSMTIQATNVASLPYYDHQNG